MLIKTAITDFCSHLRAANTSCHHNTVITFSFIHLEYTVPPVRHFESLLQVYFGLCWTHRTMTNCILLGSSNCPDSVWFTHQCTSCCHSIGLKLHMAIHPSYVKSVQKQVWPTVLYIHFKTESSSVSVILVSFQRPEVVTVIKCTEDVSALYFELFSFKLAHKNRDASKMTENSAPACFYTQHIQGNISIHCAL